MPNVCPGHTEKSYSTHIENKSRSFGFLDELLMIVVLDRASRLLTRSNHKVHTNRDNSTHPRLSLHPGVRSIVDSHSFFQLLLQVFDLLAESLNGYLEILLTLEHFLNRHVFTMMHSKVAFQGIISQ